MDDYLTRFRNKTNIEKAVAAKISDIIAQSLSRMEVTLNGALQAIPVAFINDDKESGDESIMYSYNTAGVRVGDYITVFGNSHLVYKEIKNIKRDDYIDCFKTILCNINFSLGNSTIKAYFRSSLRTVGSEERNLAQNFGVDSLGGAFIMIPSTVALDVNTPISISGKGWRTVFRDEDTNPGITYIGLEEYNLVDVIKLTSAETAIPTPPIPSTDPVLVAGVTQTLTTEDAYIQANKPINIIERAATYVKFVIPFGTANITVEIKHLGLVVSDYYIVRG